MQNPMEKAIAERAKTDSYARQILESLQIVSPRIQSVAAAISYLLLALHQMGMGATWMTGPLQAKADLEKLLSIPADQDIVALIPVGYPAENPVNSRKPVSEVCTVLK